MKTKRLTMAQALIQFMDQQYLNVDGKEYKFFHGIFGIFGHGNVVGLGEAIVEGDHRLVFYQGHNEQGMAHSAMAFAKQNDRRSICAVTSSVGPGATNMVTAAATASANRIPVLFLPGDVFVSRQPDPVLQQIENSYDPTITANDAFKPVSRYWDRISRADQLVSACYNAMRVLTDPAETGAVTLCLPQDTQGEAWNYPETFLTKQVHYLPRLRAAKEAVQHAAEIIKSKKHPLIICGGGVRYSAAEKELAKLAETCAIPFSESQAGKGGVSWEHPYNLGGIGVTGTQVSNQLAKKADVILSLGCRMNDFTTASKWLFQNPDCSFIAININRADAGKLNAYPVQGDIKHSLTELIAELSTYKSSWGNEINQGIQSWREEVDRLYTSNNNADSSPDSTESNSGLSQTCVLGELNEKLIDKDAIVVAASGSLPGDMQRLWRTRSRGGYHLEYAYSCMGYEVSGALGAKLAEPKRDVYAFVGDGGYVMLHSEMLTSMRESAKITILLFDNCGFQCIDNLQTSQGISSYGNIWHARGTSKKLDAPMKRVDYAMNAASYGLTSFTVRTIDELRNAFAEAAKCEHSVLIDIKVAQKSMTGGYDSWWRVGTPEVSKKAEIQKKDKAMKLGIQSSRHC